MEGIKGVGAGGGCKVVLGDGGIDGKGGIIGSVGACELGIEGIDNDCIELL